MARSEVSKQMEPVASPLMRYEHFDAKQAQPAQPGVLGEAEARISKARERLRDLINQLDGQADMLFGAHPIGVEGEKSAHLAGGVLAQMFRQVEHLEATLPSLERAIERFAILG